MFLREDLNFLEVFHFYFYELMQHMIPLLNQKMYRNVCGSKCGEFWESKESEKVQELEYEVQES